MGNSPASGSLFRHGAPSFVSQIVRENCVVIFSTTTCPYCRIAKDVFDGMGVKYKVVELNQRPDGKEIVSELNTVTGITTVPQVFVNGTCIGGGTETKQLHADGKLAEMVKQCTPCNDKKQNKL